MKSKNDEQKEVEKDHFLCHGSSGASLLLFITIQCCFPPRCNNACSKLFRIVCVRVIFDGNSFHPAEGLFDKVLPIYYTVIV